MAKILTVSGGLVYHARAAFIRFARADLWEATRRAVSGHVHQWLHKVQPDVLILFGPSAGYLLERDFADFLRITKPNDDCERQAPHLIVVDPDPLARQIFKARFPSRSLTWHTRSDLLPYTSLTPRDFADFLGQAKSASPTIRPKPKVAVLFLGVLGQIELHRDEFKRSSATARQILLENLRGFEWASVHDLESTKLTKPLGATSLKKIFDRIEKEKADSSWPTQTKRVEAVTCELPQLGTSATDWTDHETAWLGEPTAIIPWLISNKRLHLLGWTER